MATPIPENHVKLELSEIALVTGGETRSGGRDSIVGVTTDSRGDVAGKLFVALTGERFDGHEFVADVARRGAAAVVVSKNVDVPADVGVVRVPDTLSALGVIARFHRQRWGGTLVAVGGSAGKTTTKGAIAAFLETALPGAVHSERGNLNNLVGVPMVLFGLTVAHRVCVTEIGTNQRGEIGRLANMVMADTAVLTLVAVEHSEGIGDIDAIEKEEGALLATLGAAGTAVGNVDDERVSRQLGASPAMHKIGYGRGAGASYRIAARTALDLRTSLVELERPVGERLSLTTRLLGAPGALAVAAAVAVTERVAGAPLSEERCRAATDRLGPGETQRLQPIELADGSVVVDDSYNANPASVLSAAETAKEIARARGARLLLVVGEMRELGPLSRSEHEGVGRGLARLGADHLIAVGGDARHIAETAGGKFAEDAAAALRLVLAELRPGDVVLVKASRGVRAETVVEGIVRARGGPR